MKKTVYKKGFTLIELLVVIAIIGILAAVVLASLNSARAKGADAATQANLSNARAQAELYYDSNADSFTNVCTATTASGIAGIAQMVTAAGSSSGGTPTCNSSSTAWAAWAPLKVTVGHVWCVDSTGASKEESAAPSSGATVCPP